MFTNICSRVDRKSECKRCSVVFWTHPKYTTEMWDITSFYCRCARKAVTNVTLVTIVTTVTTVTSVTMVIVGHAMAHLIEALRYKLESHGLDSRWCHWNFSLI